MGGAGPRWGFFSLPIDFGYNRMNSQQYNQQLNIGANLTVWNLTLNPTVQFNPKGRFGAYVTGGYGLYSRRVQITQASWSTAASCAIPGGAFATVEPTQRRPYSANTPLIPADTTSAAALPSADLQASSSSPKHAITA